MTKYKYLHVPMAALQAVVDSCDGPDLMAGYLALHRFAQTKMYGYTSAGAKAIRKTTGISDWRAKRVLSDLITVRFGEHGEQFLIEPTGKMVKNAKQYRFGEWPGSVSYLPDLLFDGDQSPLSVLITNDSEPELRRDALLMLAYCYCAVEYGEWMGIPPSSFIRADWTAEGHRSLESAEVDLGYAGDHEGVHFWLMAEGEDVSTQRGRAMDLYGDSDDTMERFWSAHALLMRTGLLCRIVVVCEKEVWPLWIGNHGYRDGLARIGVIGDLAKQAHNCAAAAGLDPDNRIISDAVGMGGGTGVYFVPTLRKHQPVVLTIYAPTYHAATPINLSGLEDVAKRTQTWASRLKAARIRRVA